MSRLAVRAFAPENHADFLRLHSERNGLGWCRCVAWWVPGWEGFGERTAEENLALREELCRRGEYDGYLIYEDGEVAGWCQVGERDRLPKLRATHGLEASPGTWAVSCFAIAPARRERGLARALLRAVIEDLAARGVARLEAYPRRGAALDPGEAWTGPEGLYASAGFELEGETSTHAHYARAL